MQSKFFSTWLQIDAPRGFLHRQGITVNEEG